MSPDEQRFDPSHFVDRPNRTHAEEPQPGGHHGAGGVPRDGASTRAGAGDRRVAGRHRPV